MKMVKIYRESMFFSLISQKHLIDAGEKVSSTNYDKQESMVVRVIKSDHIYQQGIMQSQFIKINNGIPQGGILAPLIFIICINCLVEFLKCLAALYADDFSLTPRPISEKKQIMELNDDCKQLEKYSSKWRQPFNAKKQCIFDL